MAVAHDAVSESHTGTTGVASVASFTWNHVPTGTPRSALVCTVALGANPVTGVTYDSVAMTAMPYTAYDSDTEPFYLQVWFLDNVGSGTKAVVVNRTNNTVVTYAVCVTQTASKACEVYNAGVKTIAASGTQQSAASASGTGVASSWATLTGVTDGSPGTNSMRYMFVGSGASSVPTAGTNVSSLSASGYIDFGNYVFQSFYETAASQGAKDLSVGVAISDDLAVIGLAVRETPAAGNVTVTVPALSIEYRNCACFDFAMSWPVAVKATSAVVFATRVPATNAVTVLAIRTLTLAVPIARPATLPLSERVS